MNESLEMISNYSRERFFKRIFQGWCNSWKILRRNLKKSEGTIEQISQNISRVISESIFARNSFYKDSSAPMRFPFGTVFLLNLFFGFLLEFFQGLLQTFLQGFLQDQKHLITFSCNSFTNISLSSSKMFLWSSLRDSTQASFRRSIWSSSKDSFLCSSFWRHFKIFFFLQILSRFLLEYLKKFFPVYWYLLKIH